MQTPKVTLMYMLYLGFKGDLSQAIQVSRRRKHEIKRWGGALDRNVLNCFVFATKKSAARVVLDALIGRKPKARGSNTNTIITNTSTSTSTSSGVGTFGTGTAASPSASASASVSSLANLTCSRVELNMNMNMGSMNTNMASFAQQSKKDGGHKGALCTEKTLVMHQYVLEDVESLLHSKEEGDLDVMASCDLALFAYNGASNSSFEEALSILKQVEQSGPGYMPCVLVATSDLVDESVMGESLSACQSLKMVKPLHIPPLPFATTPTAMEAVKERNRNIFSELAQVALQPSQSIPQTEERIAQQQYQLMLRRITTGLVIGTGVFSVGLIAMKMWYSSTSNTSSENTTHSSDSMDQT